MKFQHFKLLIYIQKRFLITEDLKELFKELCDFIAEVLRMWTGYTYVGIIKEKAEEKFYQDFFESFFRLINFLDKNKRKLIKIEKDFLEIIKFKGKIYRYLGHGIVQNRNKQIIVRYNNKYVSWSKNEENNYIESKLYGTKIILYCEIGKSNYGIDVEGFQEFYNEIYKCEIMIARGEEKEVIYPTIKEEIYKEQLIN